MRNQSTSSPADTQGNSVRIGWLGTFRRRATLAVSLLSMACGGVMVSQSLSFARPGKPEIEQIRREIEDSMPDGAQALLIFADWLNYYILQWTELLFIAGIGILCCGMACYNVARRT